MPVVVRNSAMGLDLGRYAAVSYSLIGAPRARFRRIRSVWTGNWITLGSSSGAQVHPVALVAAASVVMRDALQPLASRGTPGGHRRASGEP